MTRLIAAAAAGTLIVLLTLTAGLSAFTPTTRCPTAGAQPAGATIAQVNQTAGPWDAEQLDNARTILTVGQRLNVPPRGQIVAIATALQESGLHNLAYGDADSVGIFQQRPSAGWGTADQILDPAHAAERFYQALLAVPDWQAMPVTQAAQNVQRSAHPLAYADDEAAATALYAALSIGDSTGAGTRSPALGGTGCPTAGGDGLPPLAGVEVPVGFTLPSGTPPAAAIAVTWAMGQLGTPYSYGGDCTAAYSTDPTRQCDCSSLVQQAYRRAGIDLPRTTVEQARSGTPVIAQDQLFPGDLIFIPGSDGTPAAPGHVGMVVGQGLLIHAPHTGSQVRLARITEWAPLISTVTRPAT